MKRPWNLSDLTVYSLATYQAGIVNMNVCTYVTQISMQPKLYAVAVYNNTQTLINLQRTDFAVLQVLHHTQGNLVQTLGEKSGMLMNKHQWLLQNALLTTWQKVPVLKGASAYLFLKKMQHVPGHADHQLFTFEVLTYKTNDAEILTTAMLTEKNRIRL